MKSLPEIIACFTKGMIEGYHEGYEQLKAIYDERYATFITFWYFLWDEDCHQNVEKEGLCLGDNFMKVILSTKPSNFGKDYQYECLLEFKFFEHEAIGENKRYVNTYSRYNIGTGIYVSDCAQAFSKITGISIKDISWSWDGN